MAPRLLLALLWAVAWRGSGAVEEEALQLRTDFAWFSLYTDKYDPSLSPCPDAPRSFDGLYVGALTSADAGPRSEVEGLFWYLDWYNNVRGGICIDGVRKEVNLVMVQDSSDAHQVDEQMVTQLSAYNLSFVFGFLGSGDLLTLAPKLSDAGMLTMAATAGMPEMFTFPNMFSVYHSADEELPPLFTIARDVGIRRVAYISDKDDACQLLCGAVPKLASDAGMAFLGNATVDLEHLHDHEDEEVILERLQAGLSAAGAFGFGAAWPRDAVLVVSCVVQCKLLALALEQHPQAAGNRIFLHCPQIARDDFSAHDINSKQAHRFMTSSASWQPSWGLRGESGSSAVATSEEAAAEYLSIVGSPIALGVPYGMVAAEALLRGLEQANSTNVSDVAAELNELTFSSIVGEVSFINGFGTRNMLRILQYQSEMPPVAHLLSKGADLFPPPLAADKLCHVEVAADLTFPFGLSQVGFSVDGAGVERCGSCSTGVPAWNATLRRMECQACPAGSVRVLEELVGAYICKTCPLGEGLTGPCPAGTFNKQMCECSDCPPGKFTESDGATVCEACPAGSIAAGTANMYCEPCMIGWLAQAEGLDSCKRCSRGWFSDSIGASACSLCPFGAIAPGRGSENCTACEAGTFSSYDHRECLDCPQGKYGTFDDVRGGWSCEDGPRGGVFSGVGQVIAENRDDYWTYRKETVDATGRIKVTLDWERCRGETGSCLAGYRCAPGHTGVHCSVCLPGYSASLQKGTACFQCPKASTNAAITGIMIFLTAITVIILFNFLGAAGHRKNLDQRFLIAKIFIFHTYVAGSVFGEMAEALSHNEEKLTSQMMGVLYGVCSALSSPFGFSVVAESPVWSVRCLMQDADVAGLVAHFEALTHLDWFEPAQGPWVARLQAFQVVTEERTVLYWSILPIVVCILTYVLLLFYVVGNIALYQRKYKVAEKYLVTVLTMPQEASGAKMKDIIHHTEVSRMRILHVWENKWFVNENGLLDFKTLVANFNYGARPVILTTFFVCYGGVLVNLVPTISCRLVGRELLLMSAASLNCDETYSSRSLGMAFYFVWGVVVPLLGAAFASGRTWLQTKVADSSDTPSWCAVLTLGFRRSCHHWELVMFMAKFSLVSLSMSTFVRLRFLGGFILSVFLASFYSAFRPYQSSTWASAPRVFTRLLLVTVASMLGLATVNVVELVSLMGSVAVDSPSDADDDSEQLYFSGYRDAPLLLVTAWLLVGLHLYMFLVELWAFFNGTVSAFMAGHLRSRPRGCLRRLAQAYEIRAMKRAPYVSYDPQTGWLSVLSSHADIAEAVRVLDHNVIAEAFHQPGQQGSSPHMAAFALDDNDREETDEAYMKLFYQNGFHFGEGSASSTKVYKAAVAVRAFAVEGVLAAMRDLATLPGSPTVSVSLLDFVIRAAFSIGRELEEEEHIFHRGCHRQMTLEPAAEAQATDTDVSTEPPKLPAHRGSTTPHFFAHVRNGDGHGHSKVAGQALGAAEELLAAVRRREQRSLRRASGAWASCGRHVAPHKASVIWHEFGRLFTCCWNIVMLRGFRSEEEEDAPRTTEESGRKWGSSAFDDPSGLRSSLVQQREALEMHVEDRLEMMFNERTFEWGVEMHHFLEATLRLTSLPEVELRMLLDRFEARWNQYNSYALWTVQSITSRVQASGTWVKVSDDGLLEDPVLAATEKERENWGMAREESDDDMAASGSRRHHRKKTTSRAVLSWSRLVVLRQFGFPGEACAAHRPTLGEAAKLLRKREEIRSRHLHQELDSVRTQYDKVKEKRLDLENQLQRLKASLKLPLS